MAAGFEKFIQLELPKRPFLEDDVEQESVVIRRGQGARQLSGMTVQEGHTLVMRNGRLESVPFGEVSGGNAEGLSHEQAAPALVWTIKHDKNTRNVVVNLFSDDYSQILCDEMRVSDNQIEVQFYVPQTGFANVMFFKD